MILQQKKSNQLLWFEFSVCVAPIEIQSFTLEVDCSQILQRFNGESLSDKKTLGEMKYCSAMCNTFYNDKSHTCRIRKSILGTFFIWKWSNTQWFAPKFELKYRKDLLLLLSLNITLLSSSTFASCTRSAPTTSWTAGLEKNLQNMVQIV